MRLLKKCASREPCAESGWYAYDYLVGAPIARSDILALAPLGRLIYLPQLRRPFFRLDTDGWHMKGIEGDLTLRIAVDGAREPLLAELEARLFPEDIPHA